MSCVANFTADDIVGIIRLRHQIAGIHTDLENIVSRFDISDINPLAVYVCIIGIIAARTQALCVCSTCKSPVVAVVTRCVLKTETRFMALSHSPLGAGIKQVIVAEFIHAVVMLVTTVPFPGISWSTW